MYTKWVNKPSNTPRTSILKFEESDRWLVWIALETLQNEVPGKVRPKGYPHYHSSRGERMGDTQAARATGDTESLRVDSPGISKLWAPEGLGWGSWTILLVANQIWLPVEWIGRNSPKGNFSEVFFPRALFCRLLHGKGWSTPVTFSLLVPGESHA